MSTTAPPSSPAASPLPSLGSGSSPSPWSRLTALSRIERKDLWVVLVYAVGLGVLSLATPIAAQTLLNTVAFGNAFQPILVLAFLVAIGLIFAAMLNAAQVLVVEHLSRRIFIRVIARFRERLALAANIRDGEAARLSTRFFDVVTVEKTLSVLLFDGMSAVLQIVVGLSLLAVYHPLLLAFGIAILVSIVAIMVILGRGAVRSAVVESKAKYRIADGLTKLAGNRSHYRGTSMRRVFVDQTDALARRWLEARRRHFNIVFRQTIGFLGLQVVVTAALFGLGGWLVLRERIAIGQLVAAELIVTATVAQLTKFGKYFGKTYDLLASLDKIGLVADLEVETDAGEHLAQKSEGVALRADNVVVIKGGTPLSFQAKPSENVSVCGGEGSGKTRLLNIMAKLAQPDGKGVAFVDGVPLNELSSGAVDEVSTCSSPSILTTFPGTVDENLKLGRERTGDEVRAALSAVGLADVVHGLDNGRHTDIAALEHGLSGGQRARFALAQLLLKQPRLVLIDGFFDPLPPRIRSEAMEIIFASDAPWTTLIVSAQEDVRQRCDQRITLEVNRPQTEDDAKGESQ